MSYDRKSPYLNFRNLRDMIDRSPRALVNMVSPEIADVIEPVTSANPLGDDPPTEAMGYLATDDGRLWARMVVQGEAQEVFGVDAVTPEQSAWLCLRFAQMPDIEASALSAQYDAVQLMSALKQIALPLSRGETAPPRQIAAAVALINRIETDREAAYQAKAAREAAARRKIA